MNVSELWVYPVKSLAGQSIRAAQLQQRGFENDRRWMLVDDNGRFISQRQHAHLARWEARVTDDQLTLTQLDTGTSILVPEAKSEQGPIVDVEVWNDRFKAYHITSVPDEALSAAFGFSCRLVYMGSDSHRPIDPRYAKAQEEVSFADGYPYLVVSTGSLQALGEQREQELDIRRFRPNIVVENKEAFAEDHWQEISIGGESFRLPKACARCVVITIDPDTTVKDPKVFAALAELHSKEKKVLFGMNACWEGTEPARIAVGDTVEVAS